MNHLDEVEYDNMSQEFSFASDYAFEQLCKKYSTSDLAAASGIFNANATWGGPSTGVWSGSFDEYKFKWFRDCKNSK
jgi:hypothetical protein